MPYLYRMRFNHQKKINQHLSIKNQLTAEMFLIVWKKLKVHLMNGKHVLVSTVHLFYLFIAVNGQLRPSDKFIDYWFYRQLINSYSNIRGFDSLRKVSRQISKSNLWDSLLNANSLCEVATKGEHGYIRILNEHILGWVRREFRAHWRDPINRSDTKYAIEVFDFQMVLLDPSPIGTSKCVEQFNSFAMPCISWIPYEQ